MQVFMVKICISCLIYWFTDVTIRYFFLKKIRETRILCRSVLKTYLCNRPVFGSSNF